MPHCPASGFRAWLGVQPDPINAPRPAILLSAPRSPSLLQASFSPARSLRRVIPTQSNSFTFLSPRAARRSPHAATQSARAIRTSPHHCAATVSSGWIGVKSHRFSYRRPSGRVNGPHSGPVEPALFPAGAPLAAHSGSTRLRHSHFDTALSDPHVGSLNSAEELHPLLL